MKKMSLKRKNMKKLLMGLVTSLILVLGIFTAGEVKNGFASETAEAYAEKFTDVSTYRGTTLTAPKPTNADYKNWVFAGWYDTESLTNALTASEANSATSAWAKFVPAEVLSVKGQLNNMPNTVDKVKMRLVTTIDNDQYKNVGFHINIPSLSYDKDYTTKNAYSNIVANEGGVEYNYEPDTFHAMSEAFVTVTISNVSKANYEAGIYVTPYWTTVDGTQVDGVGRYLRVNDVLGKTVDIPIRLYSNTTATSGSVNVSYDADAFEYLGIDNGNVFTAVSADSTTTAGKVVCTVSGQSAAADGMFANVRFQLKSSLMNRDALDVFAVTADSTWNESHVIYTSVDALSDYAPAKLPGNGDYTIKQRVGLDGDETAFNTCYWGDFDANAGIFDGAISFASGAYQGGSGATTALDPTTATGALKGGQVTIEPNETVSLEGVTGVMWHVDFSDLEKDTSTGANFCSAVRLKVTGSVTKTIGSRGASVAYYYEDGKWCLTKSLSSTNDRIVVPDNYEGWVYVPMSSYINTNNPYDAWTNYYDENLTGVTLMQAFLYSNGYKYDTAKNITWDEILFVKGQQVTDVTPEKLPGNASYEVLQRVGLNGSETVTDSCYWGDFDTNSGILDGALSFASGAYKNTASGAKVALDPTTATDSDTLTGGQASITPSSTVSLEGVTGVMWYVDFSDLTKSEEKTTDFCATVRIKATDGTNTKTFASRGGNANAYYYQDGKWQVTESYASSNDRIKVPDQFKGWIYVPFSSYVNHNAISETWTDYYDEDLTGVSLVQAFLYSNGYEFDTEKDIIWDEILFVKSPQLADVAPVTIPNGTYDIVQRLGLDGFGDETAANKTYWGDFDANTGIFGGALSFASGAYAGTSNEGTALDPSTVTDGKLSGGQAIVTPTATMKLNGVTGVMWYVDFSDLEKDTNTGASFCTTVRLNMTDGTTQATASLRGTSEAYYYQDGKWCLTKALTSTNDRVIVPDNYEGWVYAPMSSYVQHSGTYPSVYSIYGTEFTDVTLNNAQLYSNGYKYDTEKNIVWDEILFVKSPDLVGSVAPATLPNNVSYGVTNRIGLDGDSSVTIADKTFWGDYDATAGAYGGALSFASGVYQGASGATTALDPSTVTDGTLTGGQATVNTNSSVSIEGATGVMWYVDFSNLTKSTAKTTEFCSTVRLKVTDGTNTKTFASKGSSVTAYYYLNDEWVKTTSYSTDNDRIVVPDNYKGWIYVPFSSYVNNGNTSETWTNYYDEDLTGVTVTSAFLYSNGYEFDTESNIIWDEILFVNTDLSNVTLSSEELGTAPALVEVVDDTIVKAEVWSDFGLVNITPLAAGSTTVNVTNTYGEILPISVIVDTDLTMQVSYEKYEQAANSVVATSYGLSKSNEADANTTALQSAIDDASANSGVVYVPKGTYKIGLIELKKNITLRLEGILDNYNQPYENVAEQASGGDFAVLKASGTECMFLNHEAYAYGRTGVDNFTITGGVIHMSGSAKAFIWCCADNVTLKNVIMKDCPHNHAIQITGSTNVTISNVMFAGFKYNSTSGIPYVEMVQIEPTAPTAISSDENALSKFANYEFVPSENITIENCYFGKSNSYGAPTYCIGHHNCPAKFGATGIDIKNCTFDDPLVSAVRAYGWQDVEITGCEFISSTAYDIDSGTDSYTNHHYMILLDFSNKGEVVRSDGAYLTTHYEAGGVDNLNIHDNQFTLGADSEMKGLVKTLTDPNTAVTYDARSESGLSVATTYNDTATSFTGYKLVNERVSNLRFCNNNISISNGISKNYLILNYVYGYSISGNSLSHNSDKITNSITLGNYQKNFSVYANNSVPVYLSDGSTTVAVKCSTSTYHTFDITCSGGGTLVRTINANGKLTVKAVPNDGYTFSGFYNGSTKISSTTTYTADQTITAKFTAN